jgi:carbon monoxide dehydrogenase subunit G
MAIWPAAMPPANRAISCRRKSGAWVCEARVIETEQSVAVEVPIGQVWDYVSDIRRWASLMPGLQDCTIIDANDSRWTLKVGVGGLVRTVRVLVHVDQWDGPGAVNFTYALEGDPVSGGGSYRAARASDSQTDVTLHVRVEGGGPMAPMWEAMGRPLLPQFTKAFAGQLKSEIEKTACAVPDAGDTKPPSLFAASGRWLGSVGRRIFGKKAQD